MFNFKITPLDLCEDKVYVFSDSFSLKRCLQVLQDARQLPAGIYLTKEQFFACLLQQVVGSSIPSECRYLGFWQACVPNLDYHLAKIKAKSFLKFWQEVNGLNISFAELEKILVFNQKEIWNKMLKKREKYLAKMHSWGFADSHVQGYTYALKSDYDRPIVFYDCLSFSPQQKKWLKNSESEIELKFSFPQEIYNCENFSLSDFSISDLQWREFPQINIKQYEQKIFMDAALVNDGHLIAYGKKSQAAFGIFGSDILLQDKQSFQILQALKELLQNYQKSQRIPLDKLLRLVSLQPWRLGAEQDILLDSELVLAWIDKRYKFFPVNSRYELLRTSFLNFLRSLDEDLAVFLDYLRGLDTDSIYLAKIEELEEISNTLGLNSFQALEFFLSEFAKTVVSIDQNKISIKSLSALKPANKVAIYNATEPFLDVDENESDFFGQKQREQISLITKEQKKNIARFSFYSLLLSSKQVEIYTYENLEENVQRASLVDELLHFSVDVTLQKFSRLDLRELLLLFLAGEQTYKPRKEGDFFFPYSGQSLQDFSYSQAACFLEDAERYYLQAILGIREFQPPARSIEPSLVGEIAHKIFQNYLQSEEFVDLEKIASEVLQDYQDKLPDNYHKMYFEKYVMGKIKASAKYFKKNYAGTQGECEKSLQKSFTDYEVNLKGRLDYLSSGALYDFKTGSEHYAKMSQLEFYTLIGENLPAYFYFIFERELKEYRPANGDLPFLLRLKDKIEQVKKDGFREQSQSEE